MTTKLILESLTLIGSRKNYTIKFRNGFNFISGHTSTGKTSILEMIDYAFGAKDHKSYIEIGNSCSLVELVFKIGEDTYRIRRELFNFKAPIMVEKYENEKGKFLFYSRCEIDSPRNPKSLSSFLIEKLGLADMTIYGQSFSFRDIYKYCYLKQTEIDNEDILGENSYDKDFKRKATFEIIFNIYDKGLEEYRNSLEVKKDELQVLSTKLSGIEEFLKNVDIASFKDCFEQEKCIREEICGLELERSALKKQKISFSQNALTLRMNIANLKNEIQDIIQKKNDQIQYLSKLRLLYNQYKSEVEKKELAIQGYFAFNEYEFLFCPNCLKPIENNSSVEVCCLCGSEKSDKNSELFVTKKDISMLKRKASELLKFIESEDKKLDSLIHEENTCKRTLQEEEIELQHLTNDYVNPLLEEFECINYEIGKRNRQIFELEKNLSMFEEVDRYKELIKSKESAIKIIKDNIRMLKENAVNKDEVIFTLSKVFADILSKFEYPKLSNAYVDNKRYLPYVRDRKYNNIGSLAGVSLITMAYYLSIFIVGTKEYNHPGVLIIDSPRKNLGAQASKEENEDFKDERIFNATIKCLYEIAETNKNSMQMIVVNNGFPDFLSRDCLVAEFDSDNANNLPKGLIDDSLN